MAGEDQSLRMQVEADFGLVATGAAEFEQKMESINRAMLDLSDNIHDIRNGGNVLHSGVRKAVEEIYKDIKDGTFELDGTKITTAIEKRIADAISDRGIRIKDLTEKKDALEIELGPDAIKNLETNLAQHLAKMAGDFDFKGKYKGKLQVAMNDDSIKEIMLRFNDKLKDVLAKNVTFTNDGGEELKLVVDSKQMQELLDRVRGKFFEILNNPNLIQVDDTKLKPISISAKALDDAMMKIQTAVGNIDEQFAPFINDRINTLPNVKDKILAFQKHTASLFIELEQTIDAIDKMDHKEKNYNDLKYQAGIMRNKIFNAGRDIIKDVTRIFDDQVKIDPSNADTYKDVIAGLDGIRSHMNNYIKEMSNHAYDAILSELNVEKKNLNGKEVFAPSVQKLQEAIAKASTEALKNLNAVDMKIDVDAVKSIFDGWATSTSQQLMANSVHTLRDLQADLVSKNKAVMEAYVKSLQKLAKIEFKPLNEGQNTAISVDIDAVKVRKDIQGKLREIVDEMTSNLSFTKGAENALNAGLTLTKRQTDGIQSSISEILNGQLKKLSSQLNDRVGKDFDATMLEKYEKEVFNEAKKLVDVMVNQANNISRAITDGMGSTGFKALSGDEQEKIQMRFRDAGNKMVNDFSQMMDNALGSIVITSAITEGMKGKIQERLNALTQNTAINFDDKNTPILLNGLVTDVQHELQTAVKMNIQAWEPNLSAFDPNINFKQVFDNISKAINAQLTKASDDIVKMVNEQARPLTEKKAKKVIEGEVRGKGDMSIYSQRKLSGKDLKRVQEQGFEYMEKGLKGHEYRLTDANKLTDEFAYLMTELNKKFADQAQKMAEKIRAENVEVSKQKIVSSLSPIRDGVISYLGAYAKAVGDALKDIQPTGKFSAKDFEKTMSGTNDFIKNYITATVGAMKNLNPTASIDAKSLHADVRKLFAQQFNQTVAEWEKANPRMEGADQVNQVMQNNVQAVMNKFHNTVSKHTKDAINLYGEELAKVKTTPRTDSVNLFALSLEKLQALFDQKIRAWMDAQVGSIAGFLNGHDFRRTSIGANVGERIAATTTGEREAVNYGRGLPFPEFEGDGRRSIGFHQEPGNSQWFNGVQDQFDNDWNNINSWVNQRLLDGLNAKNSLRGKIPQDLQDHLFDYIDNHYVPSVKNIGSTPYDPDDKDASKALRDEMVRIAQDLRLATGWARNVRSDGQVISSNESFGIQQEGLRYQLDRFRTNGYVPNNQIDPVLAQINAATEPNDLKAIRLEMTKLRDLQTQIKKDQEKERKQGNMLAQNEALKTNVALQAEQLQAVLKTVPALQNYNVEQMRVNNSTNSWSARLRDTEGNVRSLQGTVDRATGSLYQHSEAISTVVSQAARLATMSGPKYGNASAIQQNYYPSNNNNGSEYGTDFNRNGDFSSSVFNTMRYMTAGAMMGYPSMMLWNAWESNKEFDWQMERARQNFVIKGGMEENPEEYYNKPMGKVAMERVSSANPSVDLESTDGQELFEAERKKLLELAGDSGNTNKRIIQDMAIKYRIDIDEAAKAFHISSRLLEDPNEAFAMTEAVVKANSIEQMDIETGTKGMEAIKSQWGIKGTDYEDVINMMIMAANYTPATVEDILGTQQRSGSIFRNALPDMPKREALATSIGLSAMFTQATARSGKEGGTFFKTILQSPFSEKGSTALRKYSIQSGFEDLDPYNKDGSQKNFIDVFSSIMEHSMKMGPEQKRELWASIFPQWHQGSASAIESFMNDMTTDLQKSMEQLKIKGGTQADTDGDGVVSVKESFQDYFNNINTTDDSAIKEMQAGNADTWIQSMQLLVTSFQAAVSDVFENLKDEFAMLSSYLTAYMRAIRDNTETVSALIGVVSRLGLAMGAKFVYGKIAERVKESSHARKVGKFEDVGNYLFEERRAANLTRIAVGDELKGTSIKQDKLNSRREVLVNYLNENDSKVTGKRSERESAKGERQRLRDLQNTSGEDHSTSIVALSNEIKKLDKEIYKLESSSARLENQLNDVAQEENELKDTTARLSREFNEQNEKMRSVNNRMDALADSMDDVGLDSAKLRGQVEKLSKEFTEGSSNINSYNTEVSELARDAGMSEESLSKLRKKVDELNGKFAQGKISADKYAESIKQLERSHKLGADGIAGGGVDGVSTVGQSGMGLMNMLVAGSLLTGGIGLKRGIFQRVKDFRLNREDKENWGYKGNLRSQIGRGGKMKGADGNVLYEQNPDGTTSNRPIYSGDVNAERFARTVVDPEANKKWYQKGVLGKIGGVTSKIGKMRGLGTAFKLAKGIGWGALASEGVMKGFDLVSSTMYEDYENSEIQAKKLEELSKQSQSLKFGGIGQKLTAGLAMAGDLSFGALNNLLGGNEASFGQVWNAITIDAKSQEELAAKLAKELDVKGVKERAESEEKTYKKNNDPTYEAEGSSYDEEMGPTPDEQAAIDLTNAITELNATMNRQISMNDSQYTIDSTKLLLSGVSQDSQQMRDLQAELLTKNTAVLETSLAELREKMGSISDTESVEYKDMQLQEKQLEAQISQNKYSSRENELSEYDAIMNKLQQSLNATEDEYGIQESQAKIAGASDDSPVMKKIQSAKVSDSNNQIEKAQADLQGLITKLGLKENDASYLKIQDSIRDLEKQQLDNLVAIKSNLDKSKGTFNLPEGIKVTDYMGHMMSNNTHKNVTTRTGDTVVNVTIDNMSGGTSDVQKMTDSIAEAVKKANQQANSNFNKQVWAGMGSNYTSAY